MISDIEKEKLFKLTKVGSYLPEYVFNVPFLNYFLFEADILTSYEFANELCDVVEQLFVNSEVLVFSFEKGELLTHFSTIKNLGAALFDLSKKLKNEGFYDGIFIVDRKEKWIFYQKVPGDLGVLALSYSARVFKPSASFYNYFMPLNNMDSSKFENNIILSAIAKNYRMFRS